MLLHVTDIGCGNLNWLQPANFTAAGGHRDDLAILPNHHAERQFPFADDRTFLDDVELAAERDGVEKLHQLIYAGAFLRARALLGYGGRDRDQRD